MDAKRFKTLNGFWVNISPVKEGKKNHNFAEAIIQTSSDKQDKLLFFFEKPSQTNKAYEKALTAFRAKQSSIVSGLTEDSEGKFLTCRTTEIKDKNVNFQRRDSSDGERTDFNTVTDANSSNSEDTVTLTGQIKKINPEIRVKKYDNVLQKKIEKKYRTTVLANATQAVIVMLWENIADKVNEGANVVLKNLRFSIDANGQTYFTTTFKSELSESTTTYDEINDQSVQDLLNIEIKLFQTIFCTIDSILVNIVVVCPRCKTRSTFHENLSMCTNTTCGATFKSKNKSIRADLIVTEVGQERQQSLIAYNDLLLELIGNTDKHAITNYFMANDDKFNIRFHYRSKIIDQIDKLG